MKKDTLAMIMMVAKPVINFLVRKAENKFNEPKKGKLKKDYVLKELRDFISANYGVLMDKQVSEMLLDDMIADIEAAIELSVEALKKPTEINIATKK